MMDLHTQYLLGVLLCGLTIHFFFWMGGQFILTRLAMIGPNAREIAKETWTQSISSFLSDPLWWLRAILGTRRGIEHDPRYQNRLRRSRICLLLCAVFFLPTATGACLLFNSVGQCMAQHDETACRF